MESLHQKLYTDIETMASQEKESRVWLEINTNMYEFSKYNN